LPEERGGSTEEARRLVLCDGERTEQARELMRSEPTDPFNGDGFEGDE
jgi:hypothetical protein|tara:strand:+ start:832 stop:975 length:144 start_codon:yes stop_codon:yes gene_type:complete